MDQWCARERPTLSSLARGLRAMPRERRRCQGAGETFRGTIAPANAPQQQGSKHRSYLAAPWPATLSLCGEHPLPCPKPPRSQPGSANPWPSPCQHRQRLRRQTQRKARPELRPQWGNHRPTKLLPASWGAQGRGCPPLRGATGPRPPHFQRPSPGHRPPSGHAPAATLGGAGRKIKISLAKRAPVLSALFFSSKDTKEFQRGA